VKILVLQANGRAFCAGLDVADHTGDRTARMIEGLDIVFGRLMALPMPVVALAHGPALGGGCELLLASDIVLASHRATIGQPEIQLAVFPPIAAALLPALIGRQRALELILTGRILSADEALEMGLVSHVWPDHEFVTASGEYLRRLASLSGPVLRLAKRAVSEGLGPASGGAVSRANALYAHELMGLRDPHEGIAAFIEKRRAVWQEA
jgi:cyclohexa-1,5-dienecarbonyl-CoA hydratase